MTRTTPTFWQPWKRLRTVHDLATVLVWTHLGFPILLVVGLRLWWDRWDELLALLAINHAATFAVLLCLPWPWD